MYTMYMSENIKFICMRFRNGKKSVQINLMFTDNVHILCLCILQGQIDQNNCKIV